MSARLHCSGTGPGQRALAGIQTTGREYRNLSEPQFAIRREDNAEVVMRDGTRLLADLHRPDGPGKFPALVAMSPYPRQMQGLGIPAGFVEAGQSDFFVPRGYAHVIANSRGTCGSEGIYDFWGPGEQTDLYDLIEWVAAQPWCDGEVGMIGVSYFAIEQFRAALLKPPHLRAIFPFSGTIDPYREIFWHGGMFNGRFASRYFAGIGMLSRRKDAFFRSNAVELANKILLAPRVHARLAAPHKDTLKVFEMALRFAYDSHPWDDIFAEVGIEHQFFDDYWKFRDMSRRVGEIEIPMYLGADWENVCMHLDTPFSVFDDIAKGLPYRLSITPRGSLQWPWESLHVEALAWYDHWLKKRDTGILEGPAIRYYVEGADEWRTAETWPLPQTRFADWYLNADGTLGDAAGPQGAREYLHLPKALDLPKNANAPRLPNALAWDTAPFQQATDLVGPFKLSLRASSTASDVNWIVKLQLVDAGGAATNLTQGWLRASHRALDPLRSRPYRPVHPHDRAEPLVAGEPTWFEIAIVPTAQRFKPGQRLRLVLASDDDEDFAMQGLSHVPCGQAARTRILTASRLMVPIAT
jgi:putative CocE/NonD family hydrolase